MPTLAQQTDSAIKLASVVDGFAGTDTFWELNGLTAEERKRVRAELREAQGASTLAGMIAGMSDGA